MISIKLDLDGIRPLLHGRTQKALVRALRKAGQTALRDMRAEASKRVREKKAIRASVVRDALRMVGAKGSQLENLSWSLLVSGKPVRLRDYPHRQTKKGVSALINRSKGRVLIRSAFIATIGAGHEGVFMRRGAKRLPIRELYSSNVAQTLSGKGEAQAVLARGQRVLMEGVLRLLPLELAKEQK